MIVIEYEKRPGWNSAIFNVHNTDYDLTFFTHGRITLYVNHNCFGQDFSEISELLDYFRPILTKEDFLQIQKICFEHL